MENKAFTLNTKFTATDKENGTVHSWTICDLRTDSALLVSGGSQLWFTFAQIDSYIANGTLVKVGA